MEHGFSDFRKLHFAKKGHIISVAVVPDFRRVGVGRALVESALAALFALSGDECYLEVRTSNQAAIELYAGMGFQIVRTISRYYYDGSDAYMMSKPIQQAR